jgi:hypothetical protein
MQSLNMRLSTRRAALATLFRALVCSRFAPRRLWAGETGVRGLLGCHPSTSVKRYLRSYQATATILVLGMPIFRRKGVGSGCACVETGASGNQTVTALQFAAGSFPERARGLNRLGLMREAVVEQNAHLVKTSYAGFMTSSPEKSLDQGRQALSAADEIPCTLGSGESGQGRSELSVRRFTLPGGARWTDAADILNSREKDSPDGLTRHASSALGPTATFLYCVYRAALEDAASARRQFYHDGKLHELLTEKHRAARDSSGSVDDSDAAVRMTGTIRDQSGAELTQFSVWFDPADPSGIPNRIEFRARSFLRLTFESDAGDSGAEAALPWLISQEARA